MFQMTIEDVMTVGRVKAVAGSCVNKDKRRRDLVDECGNKYVAVMPLGKMLEDMPNTIILEILSDVKDLDALKGRTLKNLS